MNLHGPVRAPENAGTGLALATISFPAWKEGKVVSMPHYLKVERSTIVVKTEPISPAFLASLVHPDRKASIWGLQFSPDGKQLFTAGYPSGIVQLWDVEKRKELRKIETPRGYRGSANYAHLTPDWKTLYVNVEERKVKREEKDGQRVFQINYSGEVRSWDVATGELRPPLKPAAGHAPSYAQLSPDGQHLIVVERPSQRADDRKPDQTFLVHLKTGKKTLLSSGFALPTFYPDGKKAAVVVTDYEAKKSTLKILDLRSGKEIGKLDCPEKERHFSLGGIAKDGTIALSLGGKKGAAPETWFLEGTSLKRRGRYVGKADPELHGWGSGIFSPDGKRYLILGAEGVVLWDIAAEKVARTIKIAWGRPAWQRAVSADGRYLAVGWWPKYDEQRGGGDPDPQDLPQPRASIIDLKEDKPVRTLIAPHGYIGGLAFRPDNKVLAFGGAGAIHLFDLTKE